MSAPLIARLIDYYTYDPSIYIYIDIIYVA